MFTIPLLCCIREKMLRTHKMTDLQNAAAAAGRTPSDRPCFLMRSLKATPAQTEDSVDILITLNGNSFSLLRIPLVESFEQSPPMLLYLQLCLPSQ